MSGDDIGMARDKWARFRFSIIGPLLASPPGHGELQRAFRQLSQKSWRHPVSGEPVTFSASTIERWYYRACHNDRDPVGALRRRFRKDLGQSRRMTPDLVSQLRAQWQAHKGWSYQLHHDNLAVLVEEEPRLGPMPSYATIRRAMKAHGFLKQRAKKGRQTAGARRAAARLEQLEVRSYEAEYVHALWHVDFHQGSRKVLLPKGRWATPHLLGLLDDCSRLACHLQWYLDETAETLVHGFCQAIQKRELPRSLMSDQGSAMKAAEVQRGLQTLGISHELTLPYSPYQNGKKEILWASIEGRLLAMLEGVEPLTLELLNEATQAWVELEYNRKPHDELGVSPLQRYVEASSVGRESPSSDALRRAFRSEALRTQRRSDGTISLLGRRFEIPSRYRTLDRVCVQYASWDLAHVDLVDRRTGEILTPLYPLDKTKNAEGQRRRLAAPCGAIRGGDEDQRPSPGLAPLLRKLMADYAATGLPPAYVPKQETHSKENTP